MSTIITRELKTTAKNLESLIKTAKKQLLLMRVREATNNYNEGNFKILKNVKDLLK